MRKKRRGSTGGPFPVQVFRNTFNAVTTGTPVYDPIDLDLQFEDNEVFRILKWHCIIANSLAIDDPPSDGVTHVRGALLDDPNSVVNIATAASYDTDPSIVAYTQVIWSCSASAAPATLLLLNTSHEYTREFSNEMDGLLVGRNMQLTCVFDETASVFGASWEMRSELIGRKERVSDAMFKQIMYSVHNPG